MGRVGQGSHGSFSGLGLVPGAPCPESFAQAAKGGGYQPEPSAGSHPGGPDADRSKYKDSYKYYGPNGLWYKWSEGQKLGRDTWLLYTGGNYKFYRQLAKFSGGLGATMDFNRLLASSPEDRFRKIGLINEPNFEGKIEDEFGFIVDRWKGDPIPTPTLKTRNGTASRRAWSASGSSPTRTSPTQSAPSG